MLAAAHGAVGSSLAWPCVGTEGSGTRRGRRLPVRGHCEVTALSAKPQPPSARLIPSFAGNLFAQHGAAQRRCRGSGSARSLRGCALVQPAISSSCCRMQQGFASGAGHRCDSKSRQARFDSSTACRPKKGFSRGLLVSARDSAGENATWPCDAACVPAGQGPAARYEALPRRSFRKGYGAALCFEGCGSMAGQQWPALCHGGAAVAREAHNLQDACSIQARDPMSTARVRPSSVPLAKARTGKRRGPSGRWTAAGVAQWQSPYLVSRTSRVRSAPPAPLRRGRVVRRSAVTGEVAGPTPADAAEDDTS